MKYYFDSSLFDKMNEIESYLEDDISKQIFRYRVLANLTGDLNYIYKMLEITKIFDFSKAGESFQEFNTHYGMYDQEDVFAWLMGKKEKKDIILFGAGQMAEHYVNLFAAANIPIWAIADNRCSLREKWGIPILSAIGNEARLKEAYVIISSEQYRDEIYQQLKSMGLQMEDVYYPVRNALISYNTDVYFDPNIWSSNKEEIFVDAGCYNLYTASQFAKWCPNYRKIYAFEPDNENYRLCENNLEKYDLKNVALMNAGLWNERTVLNFIHQGDLGGGSCIIEDGVDSVKVICLDDVLQGMECTFIKMDIEGAELQALKGAADTIKKWKPKLAICLYHKPEDMIEIPLYIKKLVPEYRIKIRHYSTYFYDTVLYACI